MRNKIYVLLKRIRHIHGRVAKNKKQKRILDLKSDKRGKFKSHIGGRSHIGSMRY